MPYGHLITKKKNHGITNINWFSQQLLSVSSIGWHLSPKSLPLEEIQVTIPITVCWTILNHLVRGLWNQKSPLPGWFEGSIRHKRFIQSVASSLFQFGVFALFVPFNTLILSFLGGPDKSPLQALSLLASLQSPSSLLCSLSLSPLPLSPLAMMMSIVRGPPPPSLSLPPSPPPSTLSILVHHEITQYRPIPCQTNH